MWGAQTAQGCRTSTQTSKELQSREPGEEKCFDQKKGKERRRVKIDINNIFQAICRYIDYKYSVKSEEEHSSEVVIHFCKYSFLIYLIPCW